VWDQRQKEYIEHINKFNKKFEIVKHISFIETSYLSGDMSLDKMKVSVFDVSPRRISNRYFPDDDIYYVPPTTNEFIEDIAECIRDSNSQMLFKPKRNLGRYIDKSYSASLKRVLKIKNIHLVSEGVSAESLIKYSDAVISTPYTSTALIAKYQNIPSIFYDPSGKIKSSHPATRGIKVINNKEDLLLWLRDVKGENFRV